MSPSVIFEDNHLLVLNKPAGWLVQGDKTGDVTLTDWGKDYLKQKYDKPGAVSASCTPHRPACERGGYFARTDKALGRLTAVFPGKKGAETLPGTGGKSPFSAGRAIAAFPAQR